MAKVRQILDMNAFDPSQEEGPQSDLLPRRMKNFGAASVLFYERPIEMVAARGAWMTAADGTRYLDFYNNVPSVGHCHPHVVRAITRQIGRLNTNTRYLTEPLERYIEALKARLPDALSNVLLSCTGSEANDLAMRVAMKATGGTGFIVSEMAYHGNTLAVTEISPASYKRGAPPAYVATVQPPSREAYGEDVAAGFAKAVKAALTKLKRRGHAPAAFICDSVFSSDGVFCDPPGLLAGAYEAVRKAGGLCIADEVQPGFARTGEGFFGFERHAVTPDIVTMGKPMGNGFPMAGMAARPDLVDAFCEDVGYFNTFGGNPVAAAAGQAVLDVIDAEGLQERALTVGTHLRERLAAIAARDKRVSDVRGAGLFLGVDLAAPDGTPDPALASRLINGLRDRGILIGAAGKYGHTLKVRPPLCLTLGEADLFADAFKDTLAAVRSG